MTIVSITAKNAKPGQEQGFAETKNVSAVYKQVIEIIKRAWPRKTSAHVSFLTGVSERSVQFWLAGETRMSLEHVAALLKTDEGYNILKAIMGDAKPPWWIDTMMAAELRTSRKIQRAEALRTERLKALRAQREMFED